MSIRDDMSIIGTTGEIDLKSAWTTQLVLLVTLLMTFGCQATSVDGMMAGSSPALVNGGTNFLPEPGGSLMTSPEDRRDEGGTDVNAGEEVIAGMNTSGTEVAGVDMVAGEVVAGEVVAGEVVAGDEAGMDDAGSLVMPVECEPGERLGLCSVCDESGNTTMPTSDSECPSVTCPTEYYSLDNTGQCVQQILSEPAEVICLGLGVCDDLDAQECQVVETEVVAQGGACQEVSSCEGSDPPEITNRPDGAICNEWGACEDGECSSSPACADFERYNNRNFYCGTGEAEDGELLCAFYVSGYGANNSGRITCTEFCERSGSTCVDGWNNDNDNNCNEGNGDDGCDVSYETQICVCVAL